MGGLITIIDDGGGGTHVGAESSESLTTYK